MIYASNGYSELSKSECQGKIEASIMIVGFF